MNKNKGDLETSRMPLAGSIFNLIKKYFKFITTILMLALIMATSALTLKVNAMQLRNNIITEVTNDEPDIKIEEQKTQVLQNDVIRLENEVQSENDISAQEIESLDSNIVNKPEQTYSTSWGSMKSYMSYKAITNTRSKQYQLQRQAVTDPATGIRVINGDYCVAIGSGWGCAVGDNIVVTLSGGKTFNAIVADAKADAHTNADNKTTTHDKSVVEFVVDVQSLPRSVRISGNVGTLDQFSGGVISITKR